MLASGLATEEDIKALEASVTEEVEDCVDYADKSPKPVRSSFCPSAIAFSRRFWVG